MLYYPQLATGSICQYPVSRKNSRRTVINALGDGSNIRMPDSGAAQVSWDLRYSHLIPDEVNALRSLFEATCGRWQTFTFLDPTDNLLSWSEDLSQPQWEKDALLSVTGNVADPLASTGASRLINSSQTTQELWQSPAVPGWFQYCFSAYIRADQPTQFELFASNASDEIHGDYVAGTSWLRFSLSLEMSSQVEGFRAGIRLPAGQSAYAFGLQLEPQLAAGGYKKTRDLAGVYSNSRFDQDVFHIEATGVNQYSCAVKLNSNVAG